MNPTLETLYWQLPYEVRRTFAKTAFPTRYRELQKLRRSVAEGETKATLRPFVEHKCIFIHIPKTAGISVNMGLFGSNTGFHRKISSYQTIFSRREYQGAFKFAFVRNPWDRVASAYFFLKQGGLHEGDKQWATEHLEPYTTFDAFVHGWLKPENLRLGHHFVPQTDYLCLPGKRADEMDFIGFYETLREDYDHVRDVLGVGQALPKKNITAGKQQDFRAYYTDETRAIVAELYRNDVELLGYTFDQGAPKMQLDRRPQRPSTASHIHHARPQTAPSRPGRYRN